MRYFFIVLFFILSGCVAVPQGIEPIQHFDADRYLGKWYEIARLDHSFERGLQGVTAHYSKREDGGIKVINRGFDSNSRRWREAEGKAYFVESTSTAYLKVSFFGPFYGSYIIFDLGDDYEYSLVTSSDKSFCWLLARAPVIDDALKDYLLNKMTGLGFETQDLIFVEQSNTFESIK